MKNELKAKLDILIGSNIREARERIGLSRGELARSVGITSVYVGLIERGQRGTELLNLLKIAESLGVKFSDLFKDEQGNIVETSEFNVNIIDILTAEEASERKESDQNVGKAMFYASNMSEKQLDLALAIMSEIYKGDF